MSLGHNIEAPYASEIGERLARDYEALLDQATQALNATAVLPELVRSSEDVSEIAASAKLLRDISARAEAHRVAEKEPYLRAGDEVHTFFRKRLIEPLDNTRLDLTRRIDVYKQRQLAEERERRAAEAEAARQQMIALERQRQEAEAAARRARSAETAEFRKSEASKAKVEAIFAFDEAESARLRTMVSASALVGQRFEGERSGKVGMRKVPVVYIDDIALLDLEKLRPYLKEEALLAALRQWARATNFQENMPGAVIGMRDATTIL